MWKRSRSERRSQNAPVAEACPPAASTPRESAARSVRALDEAVLDLNADKFSGVVDSVGEHHGRITMARGLIVGIEIGSPSETLSIPERGDADVPSREILVDRLATLLADRGAVVSEHPSAMPLASVPLFGPEALLRSAAELATGPRQAQDADVVADLRTRRATTDEIEARSGRAERRHRDLGAARAANLRRQDLVSVDASPVVVREASVAPPAPPAVTRPTDVTRPAPVAPPPDSAAASPQKAPTRASALRKLIHNLK